MPLDPEIVTAICTGNTDKLQEFYQQDPDKFVKDVLTIDKDGTSGLSLAVESKEQNQHQQEMSVYSITAIVQYGLEQEQHELLKNCFTDISTGANLLHKATRKGDTYLARILTSAEILKIPDYIVSHDKAGRTALHIACSLDNTSMMSRIVNFTQTREPPINVIATRAHGVLPVELALRNPNPTSAKEMLGIFLLAVTAKEFKEGEIATEKFFTEFLDSNGLAEILVLTPREKKELINLTYDLKVTKKLQLVLEQILRLLGARDSAPEGLYLLLLLKLLYKVTEQLQVKLGLSASSSVSQASKSSNSLTTTSTSSKSGSEHKDTKDSKSESKDSKDSKDQESKTSTTSSVSQQGSKNDSKHETKQEAKKAEDKIDDLVVSCLRDATKFLNGQKITQPGIRNNYLIGELLLNSWKIVMASMYTIEEFRIRERVLVHVKNNLLLQAPNLACALLEKLCKDYLSKEKKDSNFYTDTAYQVHQVKCFCFIAIALARIEQIKFSELMIWERLGGGNQGRITKFSEAMLKILQDHQGPGLMNAMDNIVENIDTLLDTQTLKEKLIALMGTITPMQDYVNPNKTLNVPKATYNS